MNFTDKSNLPRPVLSFDFDGVINASVVDTEPTSFTDPEFWIPFSEMIEHIRVMYNTYRCVVVTARDNWNKPDLLRFIQIHDIPIDDVYCTNDGPKLPILIKIGAVAHYDDRLSFGKELKDTGIDFWLVNTEERTWHLIFS